MAEKYPGFNPYNYCMQNPINLVDPDGKEIIFLITNREGDITEQLTYRKGNFWHENGKRYDPGKENLSKTLYKVLSSYRKIEQSNDKVLKKALNKLETSKNKHFVTESTSEGAGSSVAHKFYLLAKDNIEAEEKVKEGKPVDTLTYYDLSETNKKNFKEIVGVENTDFSTVAHEMKHQLDFDSGNMADSVGVTGSKDPAEKRAMKFENRARAIEKINKRLRYGDEKK